MQAIQGWFTGRAPDNEPPASVLAEWNKYSGDATNQAGTSQSDRLLTSAEEGSSSVSKLLGSSFKAVSSGISGAAASVGTGMQSMSVPSGMQLAYFGAILGSGVVFLLLAFFLFLPVLILSPSKFAITFSLGSALVLASVGALRGWKQQAQHMMSRERLPFTAGYLSSMFLTIYAAMVMHSYLFSLLGCAAQVAALVYYVLSYFPGGASGAQFIFSMVGKGFGQACSACTKAVLG